MHPTRRFVLGGLVTTLFSITFIASAFAARVSPSDPGRSTDATARIESRGTGISAPLPAGDVENLDTGLFYGSIQDAINDPNTLDGHTIEVQSTPHAEGIVTVNKQVTIQGASPGFTVQATTSTGTSGDARGWFLVTVPNVSFKNLTFDGQVGSGIYIWQAIRFLEDGASVDGCTFENIQSLPSAYNGIGVVGFKNTSVTDCAFSNMGRIGVIYFGTDVTAGVVSGCTYTGKGAGDWLDYGVELGGGAVATLTGNTFTNCKGVALSDGSTSAGVIITTYFGAGTAGTLTNNVLTGNTGGIAHGYDASDVAVVSASNNDFSGNDTYGVNNTSASVTSNASGNWWGANDVATVAAYQVGSVDFTPWLDNGTDTDGATGFQGDFSTLHVDDDSPQTGATGRIQEGVNLVTASTVLVGPGTYHERLLLNKSVDLRGAQYGVDPTPALARTTPANESIVDVVGLPVPNPDVMIEIPLGTTNVSVSGFTLVGGQSSPHNADQSAIRCWDDHITIQDNIIDGYFAVIYKGNDYLDVLRNRITANKAGVVVQPNAATNVTVSDNSIVRGPSPAGDETAINYTFVTDGLVSGNTCTGWLGGRVLTGSNVTQLNVDQNSFTGNRDAISVFGSSTFITITGNDLSNNTRFGINIKGADIDIHDNTINANGDAGVSIDKHVIATERVKVNHNDLVGNTNYGITVNTALVTETVDGTCNWYGNILGPNAPGYAGPGDAVSAGVDFTPWLDGSIGGTPSCNQSPRVHNISISTDYPTIQAAIDDPATLNGHTIVADPGTYSENVTLNKSLTLKGAQAGVSACNRVPGAPDPGTESIITGSGNLLTLVAGCAGSVIDGFSFDGGTSGITSSSGPLDNVQILNNHFAGFTNTAMFINDTGTDVTVSGNDVDGGSKTAGGGSVHFDTDAFAGLVVDANCIRNGANGTGFFVDGNHNVKPSALRNPSFSNNLIEGHVADSGVNLGRFAFTGGTISGNQFLNNAYDGLQGGIQSSSISGNLFQGNGRWGLALTGFGGAADATRGAQNDQITGNTFTDNDSAGVFFTSGQFPGTISTNHLNNNDIVGNNAGGLKFGVVYRGSETIDVGCNWWGDIAGPDYPPANSNPAGDGIFGTSMTFAPWLDGSITGSPSCNQYPPSPTTLSLSSDANPANCNDKINLNATITPSGATGSVEFFDGATSLGSSALAGGVATLSVSFPTGGYYALHAEYAGDPGFLPSSSTTLIQQVDCGPTSVTTAKVTPCDDLDWNPANLQGSGSVALTSTYPQSGYGSLEFNSTGSPDKADYERIHAGADLLSTLSSLAIDLYRNSSSTSAAHFAPAVRLFVDNGNATDRYCYLIWEPVYNGYAVYPTDTWTHHDLLKGNFWQRAFKTVGGGQTIEIYNRTLSDWLTPGTVTDGGGRVSNEVGPNARVLAYNIGIGSGWAGTFAGAADNFQLGFGGLDSLFNFEPEVPTSISVAVSPPSPSYGDDVTLTVTVTPSDATGTVEFSEQSGTPAYDEGFETDLGGEPGWDHGPGQYTPTRVASGTHGITSFSGSYHAEVGQYALDADGGSAYTRWGGYNSVFPAAGYTTTIAIYLDVAYASTAGDQRIDWSSAVSKQDGTFLRDFVFNMGTEPTGFVISTGNNAGRGSSYPSNPGHDPIHITSSGWYILKHRFYNSGGALACDLSVLDAGGSVIHTWTLSNPGDLIATVVGGNRYGWFASNELPVLAIDDGKRVQDSVGSAPVVGGVATITLSGLECGSYTYVVTYTGQDCYLPSSSEKVGVDVGLASTTTTIQSDANPAKFGTKVTLTMSVDPNTATGTVELFDGATSLGVFPLVGGQASLSKDDFSIGTHVLTAVYSGGGCYAGSTSDPLSQVVSDTNGPDVTVIAPNGGEVLFVGAPTKISWTATDDVGVTSIDIYLSRDYGATYTEVIASGVPNTGTYTWTVTGPGSNVDANPVFNAYIRVVAHDGAGNTGQDESDNAFSIFDLVTPTLVLKFEAEPMAGGVALTWETGTRDLFKSVAVERSENASGPFAGIDVEQHVQNGVYTLVDHSAVSGTTYYYQLLGTTQDGQVLTFGPVEAKVEEVIRAFALTAISPNPTADFAHIEYTVPRESRVRLSIVDIQGRTVARLVDGIARPGRFQAMWNGQSDAGRAPAGIYFVRFDADGKTMTRRLSLMR